MTMASIEQVIFFSLIGGVFSLIGGVLLLSRKGVAEKLAKYATPFAGGAILAAVFLDLILEGIDLGQAETVLIFTLIGIIAFFLIEGLFHWFHHHHIHEDTNKIKGRNKWLIVIGDTIHNGLDGVAIAASFLISVPTGIVTTIAVAAHEIPQEIGDFGLLLSKGMSRKKVLIVNFLSALTTVVFAVITFQLGSQDRLPIAELLGLSAGFLLYIAMSDVIPTIHNQYNNRREFKIQAFLLLLGVVTVGLAIRLSHNYIDAGHNHESSATESQHFEDDSLDHSQTHDDDDH